MSFLGKMFSGLSGGSGEDAGGAANTLTCDSCGAEVDEDEIEGGECEDCYNSDYSGSSYCCGVIYEEGEDTCMSCGEPL